MRRVAVFGNAGAGKSTLARRLAHVTGLPLYPLDLIQYKSGGGKVPHEDYLKAHADVIGRDAWIIDGFGCVTSAWQRFGAADTLIYLDLPLSTHYWWVTKRFLKSAFAAPEGWPENSPMWRSTLDSWRVVGLCHRHLTPKYRKLVEDAAASKRVHHLRSAVEIQHFLAAIAKQHAPIGQTSSA
jgi:adenylate kinase family enzyme